MIWGATFVVVKNALADASPLVFILLRFVLAGTLLLLLFARRARLWEWGAVRAGTVAGALLFAGYAFQTMGLEFTTPAKSAFLTSLSVVLVPVVLVLFFGRRLQPWVVAGVAAAAVGTYFLAVPAGGFGLAAGDVLTLLCALAFAGHIVAVGSYVPRHGYAALAVWQVLAALGFSLVAVPVAGVTELESMQLVWSTRLLVAIAITGGLATALAFSLQTWAQQFTSPTHTAILYSLEPVFAALTSYLVLGERLDGRGWLGAGFILFGVLAAELLSTPDVPGMPTAASPDREP